jgi:hypothetical protein
MIITLASATLAVSLAACATAEPEPMDHSMHALADEPQQPMVVDRTIRGLPADVKGPVLRFAEADVAFYVENDGTHLVALNANGEMMWRREPFVEYRIPGERASPIRSLQVSGYDSRTGHRVLLVRNATSFRGVDMISGDYVMG